MLDVRLQGVRRAAACKQAELNQRLAVEALQLLNRSSDLARLVEEAVQLIKGSLGFDALGLRLR
jgi:hypothetical protein